MVKKFFSVFLSGKKYRVFLEDVDFICKRIKKQRPPQPAFHPLPQPAHKLILDLHDELNQSSTEEIELNE